MLYRGWQRLLDIVSSFFGRIDDVDQGEIIVRHGNHVIFVPTDCKPSVVYLTFRHKDICDGMQVCQGDMNYYSITLTDDGFNLFVIVNSDIANITWIAVSEYED